MTTLLMLAAVGYIIYAIFNIWRRPGLFGAVYLTTYGLAVFFGSIGGIAGIISIMACLAMINARKQHQTLLGAEYAFFAWLAMMIMSLFTTPQFDITVQYVEAVIVLATGSYLYARTFAAQKNFFSDLLVGAAFITTICTVQLSLATNTIGRLGESSDLNAVGLAMLPELCLVGLMCYLLFEKQHSRWVSICILAYIFVVLLPLTAGLGTRSLLLSAGVVLLMLIGLRAWHGRIAGLLLGLGAGLLVVSAVIIALWSTLQTTKLGVIIILGMQRLGSGAASGDVAGDASVLSRLSLYQQAWDLFYRSPLFGTGAGSYSYLADGAYAHNMILEILAQSGAVGLLLFAAFCVPLALRGVGEALRKPASWTAMFCLALFVSAFIRHQVSMTITTAKLLFFALGCFAALRIERQNAPAIRQAQADESETGLTVTDTPGIS